MRELWMRVVWPESMGCGPHLTHGVSLTQKAMFMHAREPPQNSVPISPPLITKMNEEWAFQEDRRIRRKHKRIHTRTLARTDGAPPKCMQHVLLFDGQYKNVRSYPL